VVIVDTTVWIDYFKGISNRETDWLDAELDRQRLALTDIILCEVLQGVRDESTARNVERQLLKLDVFDPAASTWREKRPGTIACCGVADTPCERRSIVSSPLSACAKATSCCTATGISIRSKSSLNCWLCTAEHSRSVDRRSPPISAVKQRATAGAGDALE
jgi:hypothetical protein